MNSLIGLLKADLLRLFLPNETPKKLRLWLKILHPRFIPVLFIRLAYSSNRYILTRPLSFILSFLNVFLFGIEVTPKCKIGGGLFLPHTVGTVIGAFEIGQNVTIFQGVTIGAKFADISYDATSRPVICDGVVIGAGAKILGSIKINSNAVISANSLVTTSVDEGAMMIGVPAIKKVRNEE
ncbi:MAG: serine acetyltransferase [Bacteroidota bacterium]